MLEKIRRFENMHIVFWLVKDSCWMLEWKLLGVAMIIPTFLLAVYLTVKTWNHHELFINAAVLCWITANSYWMVIEFFFNERFINLAGIPFALGFVFVAYYYMQRRAKPGDELGGFPGGEA